MPVVDLVDVPEDDLVFSFHVVRDAFFLDPLHEALQDQGEQVRQASMLTTSLMQKYQPRVSGCPSSLCFPALASLWRVSHLHHDAEVFDVILLRLNELIEDKPEQKEGGHACRGGKCRESVQQRATLTFSLSWLWLSAPAQGFGAGRGWSAPGGRER